MLRYIQVINSKNVPLMKAAATLTRGMAVTVGTDGVSPATGVTGVRLVDAANNYDGINSVLAPNDGSFEEIKAGDIVPTIVPQDGEKYGTTCIEGGDKLTVGATLVVSGGKFKAGTGASEWVYRGTYHEPSVEGGIGYIIEKVPATAG